VPNVVVVEDQPRAALVQCTAHEQTDVYSGRNKTWPVLLLMIAAFLLTLARPLQFFFLWLAKDETEKNSAHWVQ
jgi:hypothetical protein